MNHIKNRSLSVFAKYSLVSLCVYDVTTNKHNIRWMTFFFISLGCRIPSITHTTHWRRFPTTWRFETDFMSINNIRKRLFSILASTMNLVNITFSTRVLFDIHVRLAFLLKSFAVIASTHVSCRIAYKQL